MAEFNAAVPEAFLREVVQIILGVWGESYDEGYLSRVNPSFLQRVRSNYRREMVDTRLETIAKKHSSVEGKICSNRNNSYCYTELTIKQKIILTTSLVDTPTLPKPSKFRLEYALKNPEALQLNIFEQNKILDNIIQADFKDGKRQSCSEIYGIIIYGPKKSPSPEFIKIVVPDSTFSYSIYSNNLLEKYGRRSSETSAVLPKDLSVQEVKKPAAKLRINKEEYLEEEDIAAVEDDKEGDDS